MTNKHFSEEVSVKGIFRMEVNSENPCKSPMILFKTIKKKCSKRGMWLTNRECG
jgi:hypothetical protein